MNLNPIHASTLRARSQSPFVPQNIERDRGSSSSSSSVMHGDLFAMQNLLANLEEFQSKFICSGKYRTRSGGPDESPRWIARTMREQGIYLYIYIERERYYRDRGIYIYIYTCIHIYIYIYMYI